MNEKIEKLLNELNCTIYKFDNDKNLIYTVGRTFTTHMRNKELIAIISELEILNIKYKIDDLSNILLIDNLP